MSTIDGKVSNRKTKTTLPSPTKFGLFFIPAEEQDFESYLSKNGRLAVCNMDLIPPNAALMKKITLPEFEPGLAVFLKNQSNTFYNLLMEVAK